MGSGKYEQPDTRAPKPKLPGNIAGMVRDEPSGEGTGRSSPLPQGNREGSPAQATPSSSHQPNTPTSNPDERNRRSRELLSGHYRSEVETNRLLSRTSRD